MARHSPGYWAGENIEKEYYKKKEEKGRIPRVREWLMGVRAINNGKYLDGINNYKAFLKHLNERTDYLCIDPIFPKEAFEAAYCECKEELGWVKPLRKEFEYRYPEVMKEIRRGGFLKEVRSYKQFIEHMGESANHAPNYWTGHPQRIRESYYADKKKYGFVTQKGFAKRHPGEWDAIFSRRYNKNIHNWNQFKHSLGERVWKRAPNGSITLERCTKKYYECKKKIKKKEGRAPFYKEFEGMCGGSAKWIEKNIGWNNFLRSQGEKINKECNRDDEKLKKGKDVWTKEDFIDAYTFLERERGRRPSRNYFINFYGPESLKQIKKGKIEGIKNWNDLERIVNGMN
ncbi:MAG: hypothetical protein KKE23_02320 [Nanoarchaeota archaeon]|nr:hypothetical protein [Nanoarchaeota archaeon]